MEHGIHFYKQSEVDQAVLSKLNKHRNNQKAQKLQAMNCLK